MSGQAMQIAFRVDSSLAIGAGHLARCLTLAEELRRGGHQCAFICRDLPGARLESVRERGFSLHVLDAPQSDSPIAGEDPYVRWLGVPVDLDAEETVATLAGLGSVDSVVVDHYALGAEWESRVRTRVTSLLAVDDLANRPHDCDYLLDQNLGADYAAYARLVPEQCKLLLGPEYLLLRPGFAAARPASPRRAEQPRRVLVYFGGSDLTGETAKTLEAFACLAGSEYYPERIDVILPAEGAARSNALEIAPSLPGLVLHDNVKDMPALIAESDLAVGAGGSSAWERAYLGLPTLTIVVADNQASPAAALAAAGGSELLGHAEDVSADVIEEAFRDLAANPQALRRMSGAALRATCGAEEGARRVSGYLTMRDEPLARGRCLLRPMRREDVGVVYEWRNSPRVRERMYEDDVIPPQEHERWYTEASHDPTRRQYVFESEGRRLGFVAFKRVDPLSASCEWGFYMGEATRPAGAGQAMGRLALRQAFEGLGMEAVLGEVLASNEGSLHYHEALGFERMDSEPVAVERAGRTRDVVRFRLDRGGWNPARDDETCVEG